MNTDNKIVLTDERLNGIAKEVFGRLCGHEYPWECAQPWVLDSMRQACRAVLAEQASIDKRDAELQALIDEFDGFVQKIGGCSDGGCIIVRPKGMHTNGGCRCAGRKYDMQRLAMFAQRFRDKVAACAASKSNKEAV